LFGIDLEILQIDRRRKSYSARDQETSPIVPACISVQGPLGWRRKLL
jgi:hypothetical protein